MRRKFKVVPDKEIGTRKERILCLDIGKERKEQFVEYCKKHRTSQTNMIKQMIDYGIFFGDENETD